MATLLVTSLILSLVDISAADYTPTAEGCNSCSAEDSERECKQLACPSEYESCGLPNFDSSDETPGAMDWSIVPNTFINYRSSTFPKVWDSKILSGPTTYYYPSGKSPVLIDGIRQYEFEKYTVELVHDITGEVVTFDANICVNPPNGYIDMNIMLNSVFQIWPKEYIYALQIITDYGRGIQFFHNSYVGGAYGSMNYIDTGTRNMGVLIHETGHSMEQYRRRVYQGGDTQILNPKWRRAIQCDSIRTTWYGSLNEWEDMAEFAKMYCYYMLRGELSELLEQSPERFRLWEETLCMAETDYTEGPTPPCGGSKAEIPSTSPSPSLTPTLSPTTCKSVGSYKYLKKKFCNGRANKLSAKFARFWKVKTGTRKEVLDGVCAGNACTQFECCEWGVKRNCINTGKTGLVEGGFTDSMCGEGWKLLPFEQRKKEPCTGKEGKKCSKKNCCEKV